jgi:hypothetical protein
MTSDPISLNNIREDVSLNLWAIVKKSLRRRKDERYESAMAMANDLRDPDSVDLSILKKLDPPLQSVASTKKTSWAIMIGGIVLGFVILTLIILYSNKII